MRAQQPDGKQQLGEAFLALNEAKQVLVEKKRVADAANAAVEQAEKVHAKADARVNELIALLAAGGTNEARHETPKQNGAPGPKEKPKSNEAKGLTADNRLLPIYLRIGLLLLENNVLDYEAAATRLWRSGIPLKVTKNRISTHLSRLADMGIVKGLGDNRFEVDERALYDRIEHAPLEEAQ